MLLVGMHTMGKQHKQSQPVVSLAWISVLFPQSHALRCCPPAAQLPTSVWVSPFLLPHAMFRITSLCLSCWLGADETAWHVAGLSAAWPYGSTKTLKHEFLYYFLGCIPMKKKSFQSHGYFHCFNKSFYISHSRWWFYNFFLKAESHTFGFKHHWWAKCSGFLWNTKGNTIGWAPITQLTLPHSKNRIRNTKRCHNPQRQEGSDALPGGREVSVLFLILSRILVRLRDAPAALQPHQPAWKLWTFRTLQK